MENNTDMNQSSVAAAQTKSGDIFSTASKMTALELNNIRLDVKHTILTPDYLEKLTAGDPSDSKDEGPA